MAEYETVIIPEEIIRDFSFSVVNGLNFAFDITQSGNSIGLDFWINNNGAAALTIAWNGLPPITVAAGAAFGLSNTKWWLLEVISAVNYDLIMTGVRRTTLQAKGAQ